MKSILILSALAMTMAGCGHAMMRGTVAVKAGKNEAQVCLGDNVVKTGDKVAFFKNNCKSIACGAGDKESLCDLVKLGEGTVSRTLNSHYSMVKTDGTFSFNEGTLVEKLTK